MNTRTHAELASFIWSICNLLRGPYKRNEYRKVILPLTVLRRFDCVLAETKEAVLAADEGYTGDSANVRRELLEKAASAGGRSTTPRGWTSRGCSTTRTRSRRTSAATSGTSRTTSSRSCSASGSTSRSRA